jgi:hypothetical protein
MARHPYTQEGERQMRRTTPIAAVAIGALAAVSMALLLPAGARAQTGTASPSTTTAPTLISTVCAKLPDLLQHVSDAVTPADAAVTAARASVDAKRTAMSTALGDLATALVAHLRVLDAGGDFNASGAVVKAKQASYVDSVVAWSKARTQLFDREQQLVFGELQRTLIESVQGGACP